jgi:hypothetical protein
MQADIEVGTPSCSSPASRAWRVALGGRAFRSQGVLRSKYAKPAKLATDHMGDAPN